MTDELKKTIENHRKMWEFIKEEEKDCGYRPNLNNRYALKSNYLYNYTDGDEPHNNCYLCDYAYKEYKRNRVGTMCDYCPCLWGSELYQHDFYCEPSFTENAIYWYKSPVERIINLPVKPELL